MAQALLLALSASGIACGGSDGKAPATNTNGSGGAAQTNATSMSSNGSVSMGGGSTDGTTSMGGNSTSNGGGSSSSGGMMTSDSVGTGPSAPCEPTGEMPDGAPEFEAGVWTEITPPELVTGAPETMIAQGVAVDPCNTGTIYWGNTPYELAQGGLFKSTDAGATWREIGEFEAPVHIRVDPDNPLHLYVGDGVRGANLGFWVSWDAGETWRKPQALVNMANEMGAFFDDVYDVAVNPTDFKHIILSSHSAWKWQSPEYGEAAGLLESKDGGDTWTVHPPELSWGAGHSIDFLYNPELGIGDENTWLLGTQGNGIWRTTDAGENWVQVSTIDIFHGGNDIYYTSSGSLFAGSASSLLRSEDNGETWTELEPNLGYTAVHGDGTNLFTAPPYARGEQPFIFSPEDDGDTWEPWEDGAQTFESGGPFEMAFEEATGIFYSSNWYQGLWAMRKP